MRPVSRGGVTRWVEDPRWAPSQDAIARAWKRGYQACLRAKATYRPVLIPEHVRSEAEVILAGLTPDPPDVIAARQEALNAM